MNLEEINLQPVLRRRTCQVATELIPLLNVVVRIHERPALQAVMHVAHVADWLLRAAWMPSQLMEGICSMRFDC